MRSRFQLFAQLKGLNKFAHAVRICAVCSSAVCFLMKLRIVGGECNDEVVLREGRASYLRLCGGRTMQPSLLVACLRPVNLVASHSLLLPALRRKKSQKFPTHSASAPLSGQSAPSCSRPLRYGGSRSFGADWATLLSHRMHPTNYRLCRQKYFGASGYLRS